MAVRSKQSRPAWRPLVAIGLTSAAGLLTAVFAASAFSASGAASHASAKASLPTTITVTAGKPTEFGFKLSKTSGVPVGKVIFKVTNKGKIPHSFKICNSPSGGTANTCVGHATPNINPGKSATLTVTLTKGKHEYLCTVPGHAAGGMKGVLGVGVVVKTPTAPPITAPTGPTTTSGGGGGGSPQNIGAPEGPLIGDPVAGASVFQAAGCASCHTLAKAGATGTVGPNLDQVAPDEQTVITNVTYGNAMGMPAFGSQFSATQIQNVAAYVEQATH